MAENNDRSRSIEEADVLLRVEYDAPYGNTDISRPDVSPDISDIFASSFVWAKHASALLSSRK